MKLTSNEIEWEGGKNFVYVFSCNNGVYAQTASKVPQNFTEGYIVNREQPKLRLSYFKSIGLKLVDGDKFINNRNAELTVGVDVNEFLANQSDCELSVISHLAWRDVSGMEPMVGSMVIVDHPEVGGCKWYSSLMPLGCSIEGAPKKWKPDIKELIKNQEKHDQKDATSNKTKVEYKLVDWFSFDLKKEFDNKKLYYMDGSGGYGLATSEVTIARLSAEDNLYRKVETEITWKDELKEFMAGLNEFGLDCCVSDILDDSLNERAKLFDKEFIAMCHYVASMTDNKE